MTASAENFGQAMAFACRKRDLALTVFPGVTANPFEVERMPDLGARVVLHGPDFDEAKAEARRVAGASGDPGGRGDEHRGDADGASSRWDGRRAGWVLGVAALIENRDKFNGCLAGTILCGGNLTAAQLETWL